MCSPGKLGEVPCLKGCQPIPSLRKGLCAPVNEGVQMDRLLLSLARLTLKSTESLWICT